MAGSSGDFQLTHSTITITGNSGTVNFTQLSIRQGLADVGSGSFNWRQEGSTTLADQISFYNRIMGKQVDISIGDEYRFSGVITSIYMINEDVEASEYLLSFSGMMVKLHQFRECNSWVKKTFGAMLRDINPDGLSITAPTQDSDALFYTVQYNQTSFEFMRMMAARLGFWMYFDGQTLSFDAPSNTPVELTKDRDLQNITLLSTSSRGYEQLSGFDTFTGAAINNNQQPPDNSGLIGSATNAGKAIFGDNRTSLHVAHAANEQVLQSMNNLQAQSTASASVTLQGLTHNSELNIGKKIKINEVNGSSAGEFIITEITHNCVNGDSYSNFIHFVPAEIHVPPFTNPLVHPICNAQPAIVVENVDEDGHDRIKVRFPWQKPTETTPWLSIVTPYAGKDKGMRFIPEKDEEVMVDFISHNAERPYVIGTMFTGANKSGIDHGNNCVKSLGSVSGRRFEINDCAGTLKVYDNYSNRTPKNGMMMKRKDDTLQTLIESQKDEQNYSVVALNNEEYLNLGLMNGGALVCEIRLEKDGKKITIKSDTTIDIQSGTINMNAEHINIKASKELKMEGTEKGTSVAGQKINFDGTTDVSIKGVKVAIEASATLDLKASGITTISGSLVKIN